MVGGVTPTLATPHARCPPDLTPKTSRQKKERGLFRIPVLCVVVLALDLDVVERQHLGGSPCNLRVPDDVLVELLAAGGAVVVLHQGLGIAMHLLNAVEEDILADLLGELARGAGDSELQGQFLFQFGQRLLQIGYRIDFDGCGLLLLCSHVRLPSFMDTVTGIDYFVIHYLYLNGSYGVIQGLF